MAWPLPRPRSARPSPSRRARRAPCVPGVARLEPRVLLSLNIQFDYSFDSNNFFDTQAKKDELQAAANAIEGDLGNSLAAITPTGGNTWTPEFFNPANPQSVTTLNNIAVPANTIVIYVGGSALGGSEGGFGGPGGIETASGSSAWLSTLQTRGESGSPPPFAPWGGSISFDTLSTNWYFGSDPAGLQSGQVDFFSVAEHEIGHVLGIGTSQQWGNQVQGNFFDGPASEAAEGGQPVPLSPDQSHFAQGVISDHQTAVMTPVIAAGQRRYFTPLDFAALEDLGWQVQATGPVIQFPQATASVAAGPGSDVVTVTRLGSVANTASVQYATADGTARHGIDYTSTSGTLHFAAGQSSATINVPLLSNPAQSGDVGFSVNLSNPIDAALGNPSVETVTLTKAAPATSLVLTASAESIAGGQPLTLTATVAETSGSTTPSGGTVVFKDGATTLGTANLVNGTASITTNALAGGTHVLTASYGGTASFGASSSGAGPGSLITTYAGIGTSGFGGDGGPATSAGLSGPFGVAVDGSGDVFIADSGNNRVREVSPTGVITTVAGDGTAGDSGDGGQATAAALNFPVGVAVDGSGNLYIVDGLNNVIRKVTPAGVISTFAGTGGHGHTGDGGLATSATFGQMLGIAVDASGDVFVSDFGNDDVRKINPAGIISTYAGIGSVGHGGDGGPAAAAQLNDPSEVAVDASGDLFIGEQINSDVRKVTPAGIISTVAGDGIQGFGGDGGPATAATFRFPYGLAVDASGDLFLTDTDNNRVREVDASGTVSTVAGTGLIGSTGDGGPAGAADASLPTDLAIDAAGDLFFIDANSDVREVSAGVLVVVSGGGGGNGTAVTLAAPATAIEGRSITLVATLPVGATGTVTFEDGQIPLGTAPVVVGVARLLTSAMSVGFHAVTAIYSGDSNDAPGTSDPSGLRVSYGTFTTLAASSTRVSSGQSVTLTATVAVDPPGSSTPTGGTVTFTDGPTTLGTANLVNGTASLAVSTLGVGQHTIVATYSGDGSQFAGSGSGVGPGSLVTAITGERQDGYAGDGGPATSAKFHQPSGSAYDSAGNLYIVDTGNSVIRKITPGGIVTTFAGNGVAGFAGDGGPATSAEFNQPEGLTVDASGDVFVADTLNHRVREITPSGIVTTVAGTGLAGDAGDGGLATLARIDQPKAVLFDAPGDLLIGDVFGVRSVNPAGIISTIAGDGTQGDTGDGGPARSAEVEFVSSLAWDSWGDLYIGSDVDSIVRMVNPTGTITTVAGQFRKIADSGDGGPATSAQIDSVGGVAVDASGDLFITDTDDAVVRMVNPSGIISTVVGIPPAGHPGTGDGGPASAAQFSAPTGLVFDSAGDLIVADLGDDAVRRVAPGVLVTVGPASRDTTKATLTFPYNPPFVAPAGRPMPIVVAVTSGGPVTGTVSLYVNDVVVATAPLVDGVARLLTPPLAVGTDAIYATYSGDANHLPSTSNGSTFLTENKTFTTLAVSNAAPGLGQSITLTATVANALPGMPAPTGGTVDFLDGGVSLGSATLVNGVAAIAVSSLTRGPHTLLAYYEGDGSQFLQSFSTISPASLIWTVAGTGQLGNAGDGGPATAAKLGGATAVAFDASGDYFIADDRENVVREVSSAGVISTVAGNGTAGDTGDGGPATSAEIAGLTAIAIDAAGNLYIADDIHNVVREVTPAGVISTVAGTRVMGHTGDGGPATSAEVDGPFALAVDAFGDLYIAEFQGSDVRVVDPTGVIRTYAGTGSIGDGGDGGPATQATLRDPSGLAVDPDGDLFIADFANNVVREVSVAGTISAVAGTGASGFSGDGGLATAATLNGPRALAFDAFGDLFISDYGNDRVREVTPDGLIATVTGNGVFGTTGEQGPASAAEINEPTGLAVDPRTNIYVLGGSLVIGTAGDSRVHEIYDGLPVTVGAPATATALTSSTVSSVVGQSVTFTAVVTASDGRVPTGAVTFKDGATVLGTGTLSPVAGVDTTTFTTSALALGGHSITASYPSGSSYLGSVSPSAALTIGQDATRTAVSASTASPVLGQPVTLTATVAVVAPGIGVPSGTVTFKDGATVLGTGSLSTTAGVTTAAFTTSALGLGAHSIAAAYGGDANDAGSASTASALSIGQDATKTTVAVSPATPVVGKPMTLTATVSVVSPGTGTPSGTVDFLDGATDLGSANLVTVGGVTTASLVSTPIAAGEHTIRAVYAGDPGDQGSSGQLIQVVANAATTTTLTTSPAAPVLGQPVTLTATVTISAGVVAPTGLVTFQEGEMPLGGGTLTTTGGVTTATFTTSALSVGSHMLTAAYPGDDSYGSSTSAVFTVTIGKDATKTTVSVAPGPLLAGQQVTFTAITSVLAPGAGSPGGTVTFKDGATTLGTAPVLDLGGVKTATFTSSALLGGSHSITAAYGGDGNDTASTSSALPVSLIGAAGVTLSSSALSPVLGQSVSLTARVTPPGGTGTSPTGAVTFKDGSAVLGTGTLSTSGGLTTATFATSLLGVGKHSITATYGGDGHDAPASSAPLPLTIGPDATTSLVLASTPTPVRGQTVTIYDVVSVNAPGVGTPGGAVTFKIGSTVLAANVPLVTSGVHTFAAWTSNPLAMGTYTITASFVGNPLDSPSGGSTTFVVGRDSTSVVITETVAKPVRGQGETIVALLGVRPPGSGTPSGTVSFEYRGVVLATEPVVVSGTQAYAAMPMAPLALGTYTFTAVYNGDPADLPASASATIVAGPDATATSTATATPTPVRGQSITLVAAVSARAPGAGSPTGTVTFKDGATILGTGKLATIGGAQFATLTTSSLGLGAHSITAVYGGDAGDQGSTSSAFSVTVKPDATRTAGSASPASAAKGKAVVLYAFVTASAPGGGTPTGLVNFLDNGKSIGGGYLGTVNGTTYTYFVTSTLTPGTHSITAVYRGDAGDLSSTSVPFSVTINGSSGGAATSEYAPTPPAPGPIAPVSLISTAPPPVGPPPSVRMSIDATAQDRAWLAALDALAAEKDGTESAFTSA